MGLLIAARYTYYTFYLILCSLVVYENKRMSLAMSNGCSKHSRLRSFCLKPQFALIIVLTKPDVILLGRATQHPHKCFRKKCSSFCNSLRSVFFRDSFGLWIVIFLKLLTVHVVQWI